MHKKQALMYMHIRHTYIYRNKEAFKAVILPETST